MPLSHVADVFSSVIKLQSNNVKLPLYLNPINNLLLAKCNHEEINLDSFKYPSNLLLAKYNLLRTPLNTLSNLLPAN